VFGLRARGFTVTDPCENRTDLPTYSPTVRRGEATLRNGEEKRIDGSRGRDAPECRETRSLLPHRPRVATIPVAFKGLRFAQARFGDRGAPHGSCGGRRRSTRSYCGTFRRSTYLVPMRPSDAACRLLFVGGTPQAPEGTSGSRHAYWAVDLRHPKTPQHVTLLFVGGTPQEVPERTSGSRHAYWAVVTVRVAFRPKIPSLGRSAP
jgi:hypothetical protein